MSMIQRASSLLRASLLLPRGVSSMRSASSSESKEPEKADNDSQVDDIFERLKPPDSFQKAFSREKKARYQNVLKHFEVFCYFGKYLPSKMTEEHWKHSMTLESVDERIGYWEYLALTERRQQRREKTNHSKMDNYKQVLAEQQKIYDSGGMGYGPEMYQLISNPMRNQRRVNNIEATKVLASMKTDSPRIALDLQYVHEMNRRDQSELGNQMQYVISENFSARNPLVIDFVNAPPKEFLDQWLAKSVGYYTGSYMHQTILPDFSTKGIQEFYGNPKQIVYISPNARDVIDGPLTADVIGVCVTKGRQREALSAARRANIRAYRLPIHRYVKWKSGPQFLPFPNLMNVFREVYQNGGDWSRALHNNISKRHLIGDDDEMKKQQALRRKSREEERLELRRIMMRATQDRE